jgi:hypothetical protein
MDKAPRKMLRLSSILVQLCDAGAAELAHQPSADRFSDTGKSDGAVPQGESLQPESARRRRLWRKRRVPSYLTVGEIIDRTSHAGFGFLLGFLALISIPFFGLSTPFGLAIAFVAGQMALGRKRPWLPRNIRRRHVSLVTLNWLSTRVARWTAGLEKAIRPRLGLFVRGPFWIACGAAIMIQGLGLALPMPLPGSNWIFVFPVMVYGIGLLEDDGVLIMAGHAITIIELVLIIRAWNAITASILSIWS